MSGTVVYTMESTVGRIKFKDFFTLQLQMFKVLGFDLFYQPPLAMFDKITDFLMRIEFFTCCSCIITVVTLFLVRLIQGIQNITVVVRVLPNIINMPYNFLTKYILFIFRRNKIIRILDKLNEFFPKSYFEQRKYKLEERLSQFTTFVKVYSMCYLTIVSPPTVYSSYQLIVNGVRKPLVEIWFPFDDTANDFNFILSSLWIVTCASIGCFILIATDWTIFAIVNILAIEFDMLRKDLVSAINDSNERLIIELIKRHQKLIAIFDEIAEIFWRVFLGSFLIGSASVSVSSFQLATATDLGELGYCIPYTLGSLSQIFTYCYYGQLMIDSTFAISTGINESHWHALKGVKMKKTLVTIMQRAQKPSRLSAYGLVVLDLETFSMILSTAFSYFTLLKNLYFE